MTIYRDRVSRQCMRIVGREEICGWSHGLDSTELSLQRNRLAQHFLFHAGRVFTFRKSTGDCRNGVHKQTKIRMGI